jgi:hypothetical protein
VAGLLCRAVGANIVRGSVTTPPPMSKSLSPPPRLLCTHELGTPPPISTPQQLLRVHPPLSLPLGCRRCARLGDAAICRDFLQRKSQAPDLAPGPTAGTWSN